MGTSSAQSVEGKGDRVESRLSTQVLRNLERWVLASQGSSPIRYPTYVLQVVTTFPTVASTEVNGGRRVGQEDIQVGFGGGKRVGVRYRVV